MRWGRVGLVVLLAAVVPARVQAQCPGSDGSLPGSEAKVYTVAVGDEALYVDDRGYYDFDDDGQEAGIWIYRESNGEAGLQRGGPHLLDGPMPGGPPAPPAVYIAPIPLLPPDPDRPVRPEGLTLFPNGFFMGGGWTCAGGDCGWPTDPCVDGEWRAGDTLIF